LSGLPSSGSWTVTSSPSGATLNGTGTTANFGSLPAGTYTFTVTNVDGCTSVASTTSATINTAPSGPAVTIVSQSDVTCNGDTDGAATVNASGGTAPYSYNWTSGAGNTASASGLNPGTYMVTVTDNAGCTSTLGVTINEPLLIAPNTSSTNIDCASSIGGSITTAASGGTGAYTYSWTPGGQTTSSLSSLQPGNYTVTVTDANGCSTSQTGTVGVTGSLSVSATPNYAEITAGESVSIQTTGGNSYTWTPATDLSCTDCANPTATPSSSTEYIVSATDANGCAGQDTVYIKVSIECGEYFVPTAFSPNESGPTANNTLCVFGVPACVAELDFTIYNRWGEVVFQTTDITKCWDGTYKEKLMDSGIFVYKLYVKLVDDTIIEQSGNTTLVR
jgi:gliding motility-associated-like protein